MQVARDEFKRFCYASIIDYLKAKGIQFESNGKEGYYHLADHDSLVIVKEGTGHYKHDTFFWNSRGLQGSLYRFITEYMGIPKGKFVDEVLATLGEDAGPKIDQVTVREEDFDESQFADCGFHQQVAAALMQQVGLSQALVERLFELDLVRQLDNGEGVLMWRNPQGKIVGGSQLFNRGDQSMTTRTCHGSKYYYGFTFGYNYHDEQDDYQLLVFQDPLRALAYYQQLARTNAAGVYRFLSVGGAGTRLPAIDNYVQLWGLPTAVRLCVDNSDAGLLMGAKFYLNDGGSADHVQLAVDDVDHYAEVPVSFDYPVAGQQSFISENLTGDGQPRARTYQELLSDYDAAHQAGAAKQLIQATPGIMSHQTTSTQDDGEFFGPTADDDNWPSITPDDLPF
ncbi:MAG TPA: hypothetical protein H9876_05805 [Candidatus Limosilactobacillus merdipullorum]|uniref:DUF3991 domain-containing protein n=1 Tax=Candidatus Limosilactobacillus merdipullorum TaxID=2838653 RepID=A0A9D1QQ17_9LACO|nr:hypothetical protein [Candidatus Limosilactobacillus merdipullorum]